MLPMPTPSLALYSLVLLLQVQLGDSCSRQSIYGTLALSVHIPRVQLNAYHVRAS